MKHENKRTKEGGMFYIGARPDESKRERRPLWREVARV